ncbi:hypothetical protein D1BOALGB6SA_2558 [Olavius sp. associated proteobacterium Delta 1]|nr:hypothetical protein D1BOALGB6SA_2558 [Olavius sp. associated proteobacterium Delta 1]
MARWKKVLITAALLIVVLIVALYAFLSIYDFNKFKPMIAKAVRDATGRELTIAGNIDFELGIRPTLVVEDVSLQNASWSSTPNLARVKRLEVQVAVLPIIMGKFDFAHLVLVEPAVIVEFDSSGTNNFEFDTLSDPTDESAIPPPPLIFSDVLIEKGLFTFKDPRSDFNFSVRIDHLEAEIPGFDESLQLNFEGAFDDKSLTLQGTVGPIWAWVEPGYALPANLTATAGGTSATIKGALSDAVNFKGLAFDITAEGSSVAEITRLAGFSDVPEFGAFKLSAKVNDSAGSLAVEKLDVKIGNQELAAITLSGNIKDALALQGINLDFSVLGQDSANLTRLGLPALPERGAFQVSAQITDPAAKVYAVNNLKIVLGDNEFDGQIDLNLAEKVPFLTAGLMSQRFRYGQLKLDLKMTDPLKKPAIEKIDLKIGNPDLAKINLNGKVDDLMELQGVNINFQASGKDLANLKQLTGQPFPLRGSFSASGKVLIPVHQNLKIPDLKITVGKNNITGTLNLNLRGEKPQLAAKLSLPKLDLPSVLLPELAKEEWAKGLGQVRPVRLDVTLEGFAPKMALKKVELTAGTLKSAKLRLTGSIQNLVNLHEIDLNFDLQGNDVAKIQDITGQEYFFAPVPGQGKYSISGKISNSVPLDIKVNDFKWEMAGTELSGWVNINLAVQPPRYEVDVSAPKFNLKPFPIPKEAAYANLNKIEDLGPLKIHSKVIVEGDILSLTQLEIQAGNEHLALVEVKGSIKNLTSQSGINLTFDIRGEEIANLKKITGKPVPLKGAYSMSGKLTDPAQKKYKLSGLKLKLGKNNISGSLDLNLSGNKIGLATDLAAPKFTLQPVTLPALETLSRIEDLGPLKLAFKLAGAGKKIALDNLDFKLGRKDLVEVLLNGTISDLSAVQGLKLEFTAKGSDLSNFKKLGGPEIPLKGAFDVTAQFSDPAPKVYKIPSFNATVGENNQTGWLELDLTAKRPSLKGELSSDKLDLRPLLAEDTEKPIQKTQPTKPVPQEDKRTRGDIQTSKSVVQHARVFSAAPLPLEGLQAIDVDLKFRNKQVLLPRLALDEVILDVLLQYGDLAIKPFNFSIGGGKADVQFALRSQEKPAALTTNLNINQLEIGPMLDKLGYERSVEGNLDAAFNLDSTGDSIAALMAALNGNTRIAMSNGKAASEYLDLLAKYLGSGILQMINPFQEKREYTPVNCFVNTVEIKDGLADVKILLDTDRTSIIGAGDVDLKTERLNLGIKPTPKKGALPANISFSFKELSNPFRLGGTLAQPALAIDPGRTAFVIGKMAGALALGPIGIAAFFADISVGKKDPCAIALEAIARKEKDSSKETNATNEKKKEKKSGGFFKRLFGK